MTGLSESVPGTWQQVLAPLCGVIRSHRCLSCRAGRAVVLVVDEASKRRVFKLFWGIAAEQRHRHAAVLSLIQGLGPGVGLMPVLGFDMDDDPAWLEVPVADGEDGPGSGFESYSPKSVMTIRPCHFSTADVAVMGLRILEALMALASLGLHHGDVKPGNLLAVQGRWVLSDFDTVGKPADPAVTTASTEGYAPPGGAGQAASDAYALGKVLYELWTGNSRLEFPSMPRGMLISRVWDHRDRLLNRTIHALCAPIGALRLQDLTRLKSILEAVVSGKPEDIDRAARLLARPRRRVLPWAGLILVALVVGVVVAWHGRSLPKSSFGGDLDGQRIVWTPYNHPAGVNSGYVHRAYDGKSSGWLLFNAHGCLGIPLKLGDRVDLDLKKDVWRGHVALYLSAEPFYLRPQADFGHRENFGGIDHLMWFHLDGDQLSAPTLFRGGKLATLDSGTWKDRVVTNSLTVHHVTLWVEPEGYRWQVSTDSLVLCRGQYSGHFSPAHLGIYAFDNTLCYVSRLQIQHAPKPHGMTVE